jgi:hypothetical protein
MMARRGRYLQTSQQAKGLVYTLSQALLTKVFAGEQKRLDKLKTSFAKRNREVMPEASDGFVHRMIFFSTKPDDPNVKTSAYPAHVTLVLELNQFFVELNRLEQDMLRVKQGLAIVLRDCTTAQDVRDALPNSMAELLDQTKRLPRTRPEAYTLQNKPIQQQQYTTMRNLMEVYVMTRAMY